MASDDDQVTSDLIDALEAGRDELNATAARFAEDGRNDLASTFRVLAAQRERFTRRLRGRSTPGAVETFDDDAQSEASDPADADLSGYLRAVVERQALDIRAARDHVSALRDADDRSDRSVISDTEEKEGNNPP